MSFAPSPGSVSPGLTIAEFVHQVLYAMYRVDLDTTSYYNYDTSRFREVVMEANLMLQEFQNQQDWNFLRDTWEIGEAENPNEGVQTVALPSSDFYRVCTGYADAVRLHKNGCLMQIPFVSPRSGRRRSFDMFDELGRANVASDAQLAYIEGNKLKFFRRWYPWEEGGDLETSAIMRIPQVPLYDEDDWDSPNDYSNHVIFTWMPDPYYFVLKTAARRAVADPTLADMVQVLNDEAAKVLSSIRENDSAHTDVDTYETSVLGYVPVM